MIAFIKGEIFSVQSNQVIVNTSSGIAFLLKISLYTYSQIKEKKEVTLHTYLHISENNQQLYGFYEKIEKDLFLNLISVTGIGPSTAIMALSCMTPTELIKAISQSDLRSIQEIKGIGPKSAQRIILELKDKLLKISDYENKKEIDSKLYDLKTEALEALIVLGIPKNNAEKTLNSILQNTKKEITLEELIKIALKTI